MSANPYQQYQQNSIFTASPAELTLMLYNGAIKFCNQAIEGLEQKDIKKSHYALIRAQDIIWELKVTLNSKYPIWKEMDALYEYIRELLVEANIGKDVQKAQEAKEFISEFRDMWKQVMSSQN